MSISNCTFSLVPTNTSTYQLKTVFLNDLSQTVSEKTFVFNQKAPLSKGEFLDVSSQNGFTDGDVLNHLFSRNDLKDVQNVLKKPLPPGPTVYVLDLKDPHTRYGDCVECHRQFHC